MLFASVNKDHSLPLKFPLNLNIQFDDLRNDVETVVSIHASPLHFFLEIESEMRFSPTSNQYESTAVL